MYILSAPFAVHIH